MNKKLLMVLMLGIFFITLASADLGTFQQGENISLKANINASSVTINVYYPNSTLAVENGTMTQLNGNIWNYTFTDTLTLGEYIYDYCDQDGLNCKENIFRVTPSGTLFTNALSIPIYLPMILMLLISLLMFVLIGTLSKKEYKLALLMGSGFFLVFSVFFGIAASREILFGFPVLYGFVNALYKILIVFIPTTAFLISIMVAFHIIKKVFDSKGYDVGFKK